ncbi:hypothetical protein P4U05_17945 [Bacillus paranthracis]|uniref:TcaA NTF2-like domain-containing protein n=1 Tax=Bacillus TaxID=1386 RepID=UPI000200E96F|nr:MULTISPECIES: hypothetical protein [Bacillus]ADY20073.1 hypothetical protein YBT020_04135 [Bacillus thuringiensis serovar finitimus YBT-020]MDA1585957.1 hypothetical protein [Bacillus cereus group sp. TH230-1LC]MRC72727.1 hypothetical protein [Bacillus thuringiensis]OTX64838.1 hypothetical protein BK722_24565 [Bacillus thuringiensis serovar finitimus]MBG9908014.1 hypothetical protein [Bacillus paranthracis]
MNPSSIESTSNKKKIVAFIAGVITTIGTCIGIISYIETKTENNQKQKTSEDIQIFLNNYSKQSLLAFNKNTSSYIEDFIEKDGQYYTGMNNYIHNEFSEGHQYHVVEFQLSAKPEEITSSEYKITTSEEYIFTTGKSKYREKVKNRLYKIKILDNKIQISSMLDKGDTTGPKPIE